MSTLIAPADLPLAPLMRRDATPDERVVWYAASAIYRLAWEQDWDLLRPGDLEAIDDEDWDAVAARVGIADVSAENRAAVIAAIRGDQAEQAAVDEQRERAR